MNGATEAVRHHRLVNEAFERGLVVPCSTCGPTIGYVYDSATLADALAGRTRLDPTPTHLCVPPPPFRRGNPLAALVSEVVDTWAG